MFKEDGTEQATRTGKSESVVRCWADKEDADEELIRERKDRHNVVGKKP